MMGVAAQGIKQAGDKGWPQHVHVAAKWILQAERALHHAFTRQCREGGIRDEGLTLRFS